jgi:hypothetical protein
VRSSEESSTAPSGLPLFSVGHPRLASWSAMCRRFAADEVFLTTEIGKSETKIWKARSGNRKPKPEAKAGSPEAGSRFSVRRFPFLLQSG